MRIAIDASTISTQGDNCRLTLGNHLSAILLFTVLAIIYTWPLMISLDGVPSGDAYVFTHCFWWYKKALLSLQNPFYTRYLFYPDGVNLAFQTGTFGNFLVTLPVTLLAGPATGVNISFLLTFILAAYFTFLLAHRLTDDVPSSLAAGFLYSFSYMHFGHGVGHLNISSIHCLPAVLYGLYRTFVGHSWRWSLVTGLFFGLTILTDQLQTILVAGSFAAIFIWMALNRWVLAMEMRTILFRFLTVSVAGLLVASPYLVAVITFLREGSAPLEVDMFAPGGSNRFSADLLSFVLNPQGYGILAKQFCEWFPGLFPGFGNPHKFVGSILIVLLFYLPFSGTSRTLLRYLWICAGITFILSLGPTLHVGGRWQLWDDGSFLKLPFYYIAKLPLFAQIRTPDRFHIVTSFILSLLAAFAMKSLKIKMVERFGLRVATIAVAAIFLLMFAENFPGAGIAHPVPDSAELRNIAMEPGEAPILWLPLSRSSSFVRNGFESSFKAMYFQTIHGKPILNGMLTRVSAEKLEFRNPLLDGLVQAGNLDRDYAQGAELPPAFEPGILDQVCGDAILKRHLWIDLRRRYSLEHIAIQPPFNRPGWATSRYIECLTGEDLIVEVGSGLAFNHLNHLQESL